MKSFLGKGFLGSSLMVFGFVAFSSAAWGAPSPLTPSLNEAAVRAQVQAQALASARTLEPQPNQEQSLIVFQMTEMASGNSPTALISYMPAKQSPNEKQSAVATAGQGNQKQKPPTTILFAPQAQTLIKNQDGTFIFGVLTSGSPQG